MNELILPPEPRRSKAEPRPKETIEIVVEPRERRREQAGRSPVSALLGAVAVIGAGVYVFQLAQSAMLKPTQTGAPAPIAAKEPAAKEPDAGLTEAQRQIASLQSEVRDLRAKLDAVEKRQPETAKAEPLPEPTKSEVAAPTSASAPTQQGTPQAATSTPPVAEPTAPVQKVAPTPRRVVAGYRLREAFRGNALIESRRGVIDVQPGDVLPDAGRVLSIQKRDGRWVVATESGDIVGGAPAQTRAPAPRRRAVYREQYGYEPDPIGPPPMFMPF